LLNSMCPCASWKCRRRPRAISSSKSGATRRTNKSLRNSLNMPLRLAVALPVISQRSTHRLRGFDCRRAMRGLPGQDRRLLSVMRTGSRPVHPASRYRLRIWACAPRRRRAPAGRCLPRPVKEISTRATCLLQSIRAGMAVKQLRFQLTWGMSLLPVGTVRQQVPM